MQGFFPQVVYIDKSVSHLPLTRRIAAKFPDIPHIEIEDRREIKAPQIHAYAKKQLFLSRIQGDIVKSCQGMGDYICCLYHTVAFVSDCHLECTYCILQDYLLNNPVITFHTNTDEIFDAIRKRANRHAKQTLRVGTGELSDSLALDHITELSRDIVEFAATVPNLVMELKTKTNNVSNLLGLNHNRNVVVSWSINPQSYISREEHKCSDLDKRFEAARQCADHGYPVGFHFDPLLYYPDWQKEYSEVVERLANMFKPEELAWISLGSLRFTPNLRKIVNERFPKSRIMTGELFPSDDGKIRYFRSHREEMYQFMRTKIDTMLPRVPHYLCMETESVWRKTYQHIPSSNHELDEHLGRPVADRMKSCDINGLPQQGGWEV